MISHHLSEHQEQHPDLVHYIASSLYVDDLIAGEDTVERAFHLYMQAKGLMAKGNFNLRKWNSNSQELLSKIRNFEQLSSEEGELSPSVMHSPAISEENTSYMKSTLGPSKPYDDGTLAKLLRIAWCSQSDEFTFCFADLITFIDTLPATKRSLLR